MLKVRECVSEYMRISTPHWPSSLIKDSNSTSITNKKPHLYYSPIKGRVSWVLNFLKFASIFHWTWTLLLFCYNLKFRKFPWIIFWYIQVLSKKKHKNIEYWIFKILNNFFIPFLSLIFWRDLSTILKFENIVCHFLDNMFVNICANF